MKTLFSQVGLWCFTWLVCCFNCSSVMAEDSISPVFQVSPESGATAQESYTVTVSVTDAGDGLDAVKFEYFWSHLASHYSRLANTSPAESTDATDVAIVSPTNEDGELYLHLRSEDLAGNVTKDTYGPYSIDDLEPDVTLSCDTYNTHQPSHTIRAAAYDYSGFAELETRWVRYNGGSEEWEGWWNNFSPGDEFTTPSEPGDYKLEVWAKDVIDSSNSGYTLSDSVWVGSQAASPHLSIEMVSSGESGGGQATNFAEANVTIYDDSESDETYTVEHQWSQDNVNEPQNWETESYTFSAYTECTYYLDSGSGERYLWVRVTDGDGNIVTECSDAVLMDTEGPVLTLDHYPKGDTAGPVHCLIVEANEYIMGVSDPQPIVENGLNYVYDYDPCWNEGQGELHVTNIVDGLPKAQITYSTESHTNQPVLATVTAPDGMELMNLPAGFTTLQTDAQNRITAAEYEFIGNGGVEFDVREIASGTTGADAAFVDWIDTDAPDIMPPTYSTTTVTSGEVEVEIDANDTMSGLSDDFWNSNTHTFTENGDHTFIVTDKVGNETEYTVTVDWIDKTAVAADMSYQTQGDPCTSVTATLAPENGEQVDMLRPAPAQMTRTFNDNGLGRFVYQDSAGNVAMKWAEVDWIGGPASVPTISYTPDTPTNQSVTAEITFDPAGPTLDNNGGSNTYIFNENGSFVFEFSDGVGNAGKRLASVDWIDKTAPTATITYSTTADTNGDVTATISFDESNVTITNNNGSTSYTFTDNGSFNFEYTDDAGNAGTAQATVDWIDKQPPTGSVSYDISTATNQDVTASLQTDDNMGDVTITSSGGSTHTFSANGTFTFEFEDEAGNSNSVVASVDWIDKTTPQATVDYSTETLTNQDVVATISFDEDNVTILNNGGSDAYTFTSSGTFTFTFQFQDQVGNGGTFEATVDWIDKEPPAGQVAYTPETQTNQPVTATLSATDNVGDVTITSDGGDTHVFDANGDFVFEFQDDAGNTATTTASVDWIDKQAPTPTITYSETTLTNQNVTATISFDEPNVTVTNNGGETDYVFAENGSFEFQFQDAVGNSATATATVNWIDKTAPTGTVAYSTTSATAQPVTATLTTTDNVGPVTITSAGGATHEFTGNTTFIFEFQDAAGNQNAIAAEVTWIDATPPQPTISYSENTLTNNNVIATVSFDEQTTITNNNGQTTYEFDSNGTFTFEFQDALGNASTAEATVSWIDKEAPSAQVNYSTTDPTNQAVTATLTTSDNKGDVTITSDGGDTHVFNANGTHTFTFEDEAGNTNVAVAEVTWIDTELAEASIAYSTSTPTTENVTATISFNEPNVTITNNNGSDTYEFAENGSFQFAYRDEAGSEGTAVATVDWIDREAPTAVVDYSTTDATNKSVQATLQTSDNLGPVSVTNDGGASHTFEDNGKFVFSFQDAAGNTNTVTAEVSWIDKQPPNATLSYTPDSISNQNVSATVTLDEDGAYITNNDGSNVYTFAENGTFVFDFADPAGNQSSITATVDWIDKEPPTGQTAYSQENLTNQPVTATLTTSDNSDGDVTVTSGDTTHVFESNGSYTFTFEDVAGNVGNSVAAVDWIDTTVPEATISYSSTDLTKEAVTATIAFNEEQVTITNNDGEAEYVFSSNDTFQYEFVDAAGNTGTATATVTWIDTQAPSGSLSYSTTELTNEGVTATLTTTDNRGPVEITSGTEEHVFTENGSHTFTFEDAAGNTATTTAEVNWIDKEKPTGEVSYSETAPTNQPVTANVVLDDNVGPVTLADGEAEFVFEDNGEHVFSFYDAAGNTGSVTAIVDWIDTETPLANAEYSTTELTNEDVSATINFNEDDVIIHNNEGSDTYTFTENGHYDFSFSDLAGNSGAFRVAVTWIDKEKPEGIITYTPSESTNQPVTASIEVTDNVGPVEITSAEEHVFEDNGEFTFTFRDAAGNTNSAKAEVTWIDKTKPIGTITYSETAWTNQDVVATITFNKDNVSILNNDGKTEYTFSENGAFTFEFQDQAGNTGQCEAAVNWIDKAKPEANVVYSTTDSTNTSVTATLGLPEDTGAEAPVTLDNPPVEHVFEANGQYDWHLTDEAGNQNTITANVNWIDTTKPTATVAFSTQEPTNQPVTATLSPHDNANSVEITSGSAEHTFEENGEYTFTFQDAAGNQNSKTVSVNWIDKEKPSGVISYSTSQATNNTVKATISLTDNNGHADITNGTPTHLFTENGTHTFKFRDQAGNTNTATATVDWIDLTPPQATLVYSTEKPTNGPVTATVETTDANGPVTFTNDGGHVHQFNENGDFTFAFKDAVGNTNTLTATVDWIDQEKPTAEIAYTTTELTNEPVEVTVTLNDNMGPVTFADGDNATIVFEENGEHTFAFADAAGNEASVTAIVDWIDTENPTGTITYTPTTITNQPVTATLTTQDNVGPVTVLGNGNTTYTFDENGTQTFQIQDKAGNIKNVTATVDWIDKEPPTAEIAYSTTDWTTDPVTAELVNLTDNNGNAVELITADEHTFDKNGTFTFRFRDSIGNEGELTASVDWIDTAVPEANITYSTKEVTNSDVTATIAFEQQTGTTAIDHDQITITNNDGNTEHTFTENGTFTFHYQDQYGNTATKQASVTNIDKNPPVFSVEYSTELWTKDDVTATLSVTDESEFTWELEDYTLDSETEKVEVVDETTRKIIFSGGGSVRFYARDAAWNKEYFDVTVDWIDHEAPEVEKISHSEWQSTNQPVDVSFTFKDLTGYGFGPSDPSALRGFISTSADELPAFIEEVEKGYKYRFLDNGSFNFEYSDLAGNTDTVNVEVTCIDKEVEPLQLYYSTTESTPFPVEVVLGADSFTPIYASAADAKNSGKRIGQYDDIGGEQVFGLKHTFKQNGKYTFVYYDRAGNRGEVEAEVTWIEDRPPKVEAYSPLAHETYTPRNVPFELRLVEDYDKGFQITNNGGSNTYIFKENGSFTFEFENDFGTKGECTVSTDQIDRDPPVLEKILYEPGLKKFQYDDEPRPTSWGTFIKVIANDPQLGKIEDKIWVKENGEYTFELTDWAQNTLEVPVVVDWIDKKPPELKAETSNDAPTADDVIISIQVTEKSTVTVKNQSGGNVFHGIVDNSHNVSIDQNGKYTIVAEDLIWKPNKSEVQTVTIDNIYQKPPELKYTGPSKTVASPQEQDKALEYILNFMAASDERDGDLTPEIKTTLKETKFTELGDDLRTYEFYVKNKADMKSESITVDLLLTETYSPSIFINGTEIVEETLTLTTQKGKTSCEVFVDIIGFGSIYTAKLSRGRKTPTAFKAEGILHRNQPHNNSKMPPLNLSPGIYTLYVYNPDFVSKSVFIEVIKGGQNND